MTHRLVARLGSADPDERREACRAAAEDPAATLLVPALAARLGDSHREVARAASDALVTIGRSVGGVRDALRDALRAEDPARRFGAAFTAARLEPPAPRLLPVLVEALGDADGDVRWAAARILVDMGRLHGEVLPVLVGLLATDERAGVRRMAAYALRALAPDRPETAAALVQATRDDDAAVRRAALTATASLLEPPDTVRERLIEVLREDADPRARRLAALSLGVAGGARAEAALEAARTGADRDLLRTLERSLARTRGAPPAEEGR